MYAVSCNSITLMLEQLTRFSSACLTSMEPSNLLKMKWLLWNPKAQITFKSDIIWVNFGKFREFSIHTKISLICQKMTEKHEFKDTYSPQKEKKLHFKQLHTNYSFAFRTVLNLKSHLKNFQAYFIKWTTSGDPLVGLKSLQDSI